MNTLIWFSISDMVFLEIKVLELDAWTWTLYRSTDSSYTTVRLYRCEVVWLLRIALIADRTDTSFRMNEHSLSALASLSFRIYAMRAKSLLFLLTLRWWLNSSLPLTAIFNWDTIERETGTRELRSQEPTSMQALHSGALFLTLVVS